MSSILLSMGDTEVKRLSFITEFWKKENTSKHRDVKKYQEAHVRGLADREKCLLLQRKETLWGLGHPYKAPRRRGVGMYLEEQLSFIK